ncbi:MAG: amidohydrolase family protein [Rhodothermales bacterium]
MVPSADAQIAVKGEMVYTMAGEAIKNGVVLVRDGKIERVGRFDVPAGYDVMEAAVVTPGLIDAHTVVGLAGYLNQADDQDQVERSSPMQPELRAMDAYNPREALVEWVRGFGVTTMHTGHGPGVLVSGQTMIVKTVGNDVTEAIMEPEKGTDLRMEAFKAVLDGDMRMLITVERSHDILTTLRLAEEFDIDIVLDSASEAYLVTDQIKAAGVPVITHPTMARHGGERANATFEAAAHLRDAGIPFALQSGFEAYVPKTRVILFEAGVAAANGLSFEEALASITIDAARLLGVDDRVGSLEVGKDADIALYDGDPFEYTTHAIGVLIDGNVVSTDVR